MPFAASWMDLEIIMLSEVGQTEKREISYDTFYRNRLTDLENKLMVMGKKLGEGIVGEFGKGRNKLLYLKWITNENLTVEHKGLCSMLRGSLDERGEWGRMDTYIYG